MIQAMLAGLVDESGNIDPIALRSLARLAKPKIDEMAKQEKAPGYVVSSVRGLVAAIERWGMETEQARKDATSVPTP